MFVLCTTGPPSRFQPRGGERSKFLPIFGGMAGVWGATPAGSRGGSLVGGLGA